MTVVPSSLPPFALSPSAGAPSAGAPSVAADPDAPIPIAGPDITEDDIALVAEAARTAWYRNAYAYHDRFERGFADYLGVRHGLSTASCTTALHLALAAVGAGPGDEVIVPDLTWIASAAPVHYVGAVPRFAEVRADTWCLDIDSVAALIGPKTRAILAVGLYGGMPDMVALTALAARHGIPVIEDAAEALGAAQDGRRAGSFGAIACFSFHASKTITTGEGGMAVTSDDRLYDRLVRLRNHGRRAGDRRFASEEIGFKYMMSGMQAALGLSQLQRIDRLVAAKRRVFDRYAGRLAGRPDLALNFEPAGFHNSYWMVSAVLDPALGIDAWQVQDALTAQGIDVRPFFAPLSDHPVFRDLPGAAAARAANSNAATAGRFGVNLPSGGTLTDGQIDRVCTALLRLIDGANPMTAI